MKTNNVTLIAVFAAITIVTNLTFYYIFFFVFSLIIFLLDKKNAIIYAFVVALINFISSVGAGSLLPLLNVAILPITAFVLLYAKDIAKENRVIYCVLFLITIFTSNVFYNIISSFMYNMSFGSVFIAQLSYNLLTTTINPLLMYLIGYTAVSKLKPELEKRFS